MKKVILPVVFSFALSLSYAQITFEKTYTEKAPDTQHGPIGATMEPDTNVVYSSIGNYVQQTADGGYIMIGNQTNPVTAESNMMVIKTDVEGNVSWEKKFGGAGDDFSHAAIPSADGGFIITGGTNSVFAGGMDVQLLKIDSLGNEIWTKTYGGEGDEEGLALQPTSDGGYIIAGKTNSYGAGNEDVYLLKTDANGDLLWSQTYGGSLIEFGNAVLQTADGGYFIAGKTSSFGAGNMDAYMIRTDAAGTLLWVKTAGGTEADMAQSAVQTAEGEFVVAGSYTSFGDMDVYMLKLAADGTAIWAKTFGGINADKANAILQTADGGYVISAETESFGSGAADAYLIRVSSGGNESWTKTYGASANDRAMFTSVTTDGEYISIGSFQNPNGSEGFSLIKMDGNGNTSCHQSSTTTIITTITSSVAAVSQTVTTAPSAVSSNYTSLMDLMNLLAVESHCSSEPLEAEMSINEIVSATQDSVENESSFVTKSIAAEEKPVIGVYPNPSAGQFYFSGLSAGYKIDIYSVSGELVLQQTVSDAVEKIDLSGRSKGFYFYKVTDLKGDVQQAKILIQ